jgi:hypothetical protein
MALGLTPYPTEMSSRNLPGSKEVIACYGNTLTALCKLNVYNMWEPLHIRTLQASTACYWDWDRFTFYPLPCTDALMKCHTTALWRTVQVHTLHRMLVRVLQKAKQPLS